MNKNGLWRLGISLIATTVAFGSLIGPHPLSDFLQNADLIIVGTAAGTISPRDPANVSLQVSRVIKGDPTLAGSIISTLWSKSVHGTFDAGTTATVAAGTGLWFLRHSSSNSWLLMPVVDGDVPLSMTFFPAPEGPVLSAYA